MSEETHQMDPLTPRNAFMLHNHIRNYSTGPDRAEAVLDIVPESLNPFGVLHGGALYTLADCAGGCAARADGRRYVTLHGALDFIRPARTGRITAQASVTRRGRTTCLIRIEIFDAEEVLLAAGDFTFFYTGNS